MTETASQDKSCLRQDLSPYIYGTTRLGDETIAFEDRVKVARMAMESELSELPSGMWFPTSHTYGNALEVLRTAFDQNRQRVPKLIVKLIAATMAEFKDVIHQNLKAEVWSI